MNTSLLEALEGDLHTQESSTHHPTRHPHNNNNNNNSRRRLGPERFRVEVHQIGRRPTNHNHVTDPHTDSSKNNQEAQNSNVLLLRIHEYTTARHVLRKCVSKKFLPNFKEERLQVQHVQPDRSLGSSSSVVTEVDDDSFRGIFMSHEDEEDEEEEEDCSYPQNELLLVASVSNLPPGYLCFEQWKAARFWKQDSSDGTDLGAIESDSLLDIEKMRDGFIQPFGANNGENFVIPNNVKFTDFVGTEMRVMASESRHAWSSKQDAFTVDTENDGIVSTPQSVLRFVKTLKAGDALLKTRDLMKKYLTYLGEDAWDEYKNKTFNDDTLDQVNINMRWFVRSNDQPPLSLSGELSGEESSDEETVDASVEIERESEERNLRNVLLNRTFRSEIRMKGFLLKQSRVDANVWRRVWCVLVDGQLWYITRMKQWPFNITDSSSPTSIQKKSLWRSKHRHIRLLRAQVTEPSERNSLNQNAPFAFEVRTLQGDVHVFQAGSREIQLRWLSAIANEIITCYDSNNIELAELIINDEQEARTRRFEESVSSFLETTGLPSRVGNHCKLWSMSGHGGEIIDLARITMLVNEYKEVCRTHVELPASVGSRQWTLNRISVARILDAGGAVCASPYFKDRTFEDDNFKAQRKDIVHIIVEKQKKLNHTDENVEPPKANIFDNVLDQLVIYAGQQEMSHKENGLFGY